MAKKAIKPKPKAATKKHDYPEKDKDKKVKGKMHR